jgi:hypothetical protein
MIMKFRLCSIVAFSILVLAGCEKKNAAPSGSSNRVIAYWSFDGNTKDSTGNHRTIDHGKISYGPDRLGHPRSAIVLDSGAYLTVPDSPDLSLAGVTQFAISAWIKTGDTSEACIVRKGSLGSETKGYTPGYVFDIRHGHLHAAISTVRGYIEMNDSLHITADNRWHRVTLANDQDTVELFLDNRIVSSRFSDDLRPQAAGNVPLVIGDSTNSIGNYIHSIAISISSLIIDTGAQIINGYIAFPTGTPIGLVGGGGRLANSSGTFYYNPYGMSGPDMNLTNQDEFVAPNISQPNASIWNFSVNVSGWVPGSKDTYTFYVCDETTGDNTMYLLLNNGSPNQSGPVVSLQNTNLSNNVSPGDLLTVYVQQNLSPLDTTHATAFSWGFELIPTTTNH